MSFPSWIFITSRQQHLPFLATPQGNMEFFNTPNMCVSFSFQIIPQTTNGSTSKFHLETFTPSCPNQHALGQETWGPSCPNFTMFHPWGQHLAYNSTNLPNLSIIFIGFFHNVFNVVRGITSFNFRPRLMCVHTSHWPYRYPLHTLHPWQWTYEDPWCHSQHFCYHCVKC